MCINLSCKSEQAKKYTHSEKSSSMEEDHQQPQQQQQQQQSSCSDSDEVDQIRGSSSSIVIPAQLINTTEEDGFQKKEQSWFPTSQIPTDLTIQVQDITFYVHKYPLVARCGYLSRTEFQAQDQNSGYHIKLDDFPGGSKAFEIVIKFCYGLSIGLTTNNIAALRCASEYLEMTEAFEDGNLISKTEAFFTFMVLSSWRDCITVLKACEALSPWAENLQIVRRCCDSIAWKVSHEISNNGEDSREDEWWFEDVATLHINHFMRIITAIKAKGVKPETIGLCITQYAEKWLPCIDVMKGGTGQHGHQKNEMQWNIISGKRQKEPIAQTKEHRLIIESLVSILPPQREAISCKFLLQMLKMAIKYSISPALISELEKRVGMVLENANVTDLLIPSYTVGDQGKPISLTEDNSMHNIEVVQRILEYFLMYEQQQQQKSVTVEVSKLIDNYLAEIARDPSLSVTKFKVLAESLPENTRTCDDGLYRAIDTFLKSHPSLSDHERRRLCKIMKCEKLSLDACSHAAQNDRLPIRTVIQVLFSEQVKIRAAVQGKDHTVSDENLTQEGSWSCTKKEVNILKAELEIIKSHMGDLQKDYVELQHEYEKLNNSHKNLWTFGWLKIKKSVLPQTKVDGDDTCEAQLRSNSDHKSRFRRRQSIS